MSIYVDILVLTNALIGYCLLRIVQRLCMLPRRLWRTVVAALLAGGSALLLVLPALHWAPALLLRTVSCCGIIAVFCVPVPWRRFVCATVWYLALNMVLAGLVLLLAGFTGSSSMQVNNTAVYIRTPPLVLVALAGTTYIVITILQNVLHLAPQNPYIGCGFVLHLPASTLRGTARIDTGFSARDIYFDCPVILLDYHSVCTRLDPDTRLALALYFAGHEPLCEGASVHLLPMHTVAGTVLLPTVSGAKLTVHKRTRTVSVAFSDKALGDGSFQALLGAEWTPDKAVNRKEKVSQC